MGPNLKRTILSQVAIVLTLCVTVFGARQCPTNCLCDDVVIDCSHNKMSTVPYMHPKSPAQALNFSFNSLTSLDNFQNFPASHASLDLSNNQISHIPLTAFSGETFLELLALNLTSNLIDDVHFVFPSSLQVLRLSKNQIQRFCVERLKNLFQLRSLYLDLNGLKTLSCQEGEPAKANSIPESCPFLPLQQIREVFLQGNKLKALEQGPILCFQNAQFLSLADNAIKSLPAKLLQEFHKLKYLDLADNRLTYVQEGLFYRLPSLKFLSLARNRLGTVPAGLPMLEWLDLSYNAITTVSSAQKSDLYPQEVFLIGGNPFNCDCKLLWVKELFDTREYLLKYNDVDRNKFVPICAMPERLRGDTWDVIGDTAFGCRDNEEVSAKRKSVEAPEEAPVVQLEDLAFKVKDVGASHIRLHWDSLDLTSKRSAGEKEPRKIYINIHPFGQKKQKQSLAVHLSVGTHRIIGLQPSTAYVVCISLADHSSHNSKGKTRRDDCVEVVTKDDEQFQLRDIYMRIGIVVLGFALLALKCCFSSGLHKDMSSRRKND
ncbi:leucine-rich repeat transmembrane protein FLRT1-like [Littorina saxatilis]|uniref:LRRCT domain-containing protein n=1 Tax=Littorina saxatilis TaxID=31220 RepID=A0AAN9APW2_9CAEN